MPGPWEDYQTAAPAAGHGPWEDYGGGAPPPPPAPTTGQHVQGHPLKGQNFGDWLTEELLGPVVNAATQLGRGIQGLGHPEQRPLTESVRDVVQGGSQIIAPFAAAGSNSEPAPAGPPSAGAPSAVGTALKGAAAGAVKAIPKAIETSVLKYTGLPQIGRGAVEGAKEALAAREAAINAPSESQVAIKVGPKAASSAEAPAPAPPAAPTEEEQLLAAIQRGQQNAAAQASAPPKAYTPRGPEYYGVKPTQTPPTTPANNPPVPSPTPEVSAAPPAPAKVQPIRPETPNTPKYPQTTPAPEQVKTSGRTFVKDARPSAEDYTLVQVPTAKIDAGWAKDQAFYIPPGGGGAEMGGKMASAQEFIGKGQPIEAPRVSMAEDGRIAFEDGRHRFATVRDAGDKTTAVMVPNEQVADFQALNKGPAAASKAPTAATAAKSARYADAIAKWAKDMGMTPKDIAEQWGTTTPEVRGQITLELKRKGYLGANETIPNTSATGIVDALKAKAATIRPPAGFGMRSQY